MRETSERLGRIVGLLLLVQFVMAVVFNVFLLGPVISQPPGWIVNAAAQPLTVSMAVLLALVADVIWLAVAVVAYPLFARASLRRRSRSWHLRAWHSHYQRSRTAIC